MWCCGNGCSRSAQRLEELRGLDLRAQDYWALMIDGVVLSQELVVIVALGLLEDGRKQVLDVASMCPGGSLRCFDGSPALHKAVVEFWPDAVIQGCLVHKERNLHGYLRWRDHGECSRLMKRIRQA